MNANRSSAVAWTDGKPSSSKAIMFILGLTAHLRQTLERQGR